jgi:hypothetical protein
MLPCIRIGSSPRRCCSFFTISILCYQFHHLEDSLKDLTKRKTQVANQMDFKNENQPQLPRYSSEEKNAKPSIYPELGDQLDSISPRSCTSSQSLKKLEQFIL